MKRIAYWLAAALALAAPARAEENGLGNFFSHLFGGPPPPPAPRPSENVSPSPRPTVAHKKKKPAAEKKREASAPSAPVASSTPPPQASKFVYVLGDSLAISAADGLTEDFEEKPEIGVVDRARDASGLVRDDYFDWPRAARELVEGKPAKDKDKPATKEKIDYAVVIVGINDMQPLRDGTAYVDVLSDRWKELYAERVAAVVAPFAAAQIPVAWVGLPPMRNEKLSPQRVAELNQLLKENAEKAGAKFVDVFDAFADSSGGFDAFGPNIEGQNVKLRGADGIHLTAAGGVKLAHFLDEDILKALGETAPKEKPIAALPPDIARPADINDEIRHGIVPPTVAPVVPPPQVAAPIAPPAPPPKPEAGPIVSLTARPASPGATLASAPSLDLGDAARLLRLGEPPPAAPGRADDFSR